MKTLLKIHRAFVTGVSFVIFMTGGFFLGVFWYPLLKVFAPKTAKVLFLKHLQLIWKLFLKVLVMTGAFKSIQIEGIEKLPKDKGFLLIANHITLIDIVALGSAISRFNCVVKLGLWKHRFFGYVIKACDFIPNVGSEEFIALCNDSFNKARPIIIFPQGERQPPTTTPKFQRGAAQIAARCSVPIYPAVISCEPPVLMKGQKWYQVPSGYPQFTVSIKDELVIPREILNESSTPMQVRMLNQFFEQTFVNFLSR